MIETLEYVINKADRIGASQAEAFFFKKTEIEIRAEKKEVKIGGLKSDVGTGVRLALRRNGGFSLGYTYTTDFSKEALEEAVRQALKICYARKPDPDFKSFPEKSPHKPVPNIYDKRISELPAEEAINLVHQQIETASSDKRVKTIRCLTNLSVSEVAILNSLGVSGNYNASSLYTYVYVLAEEKGSSGVGWEDYTNCFFTTDEPIKIAEEAMNLAIQQLHAKPIEKGRMDLIISPDALAKLLIYTFIQEVRADRIQKLQSPFVGKLNQEIASQKLTILDDGRIPRAVGSKPFDDEGVSTARTTIIEKGMLKNFLYDTYCAKKEETKSTGNSLRHALLQVVPKYKMEPSIGPTNMVVKAGTTPLDYIIKEAKNGVITKDFIGTHTSNPQSGTFSIAPHCAFKIENGEIKHPIKEAMIGGDIPTLLKSIEIVGKDVKHVLLYDAALLKDATLIAPSMLVKDVSVSA